MSYFSWTTPKMGKLLRSLFGQLTPGPVAKSSRNIAQVEGSMDTFAFLHSRRGFSVHAMFRKKYKGRNK